MQRFFRTMLGHFLPSKENAYRPHLLQKSWLLFFLTIVLTAEGMFITNLFAREQARDFLAAVLSGEVIALTNTERTGTGSAPLAENTLLALAAQNKANDMAAKGYFSHNGPDGKEPWTWISEAGYTYQYAGENLAVRFDYSSDVVRAWMASPTHRANIVKPAYREIGIGVAEGIYQGVPATFVVQYFGTPRTAQAAPAAVVQTEEPVAIVETPQETEVAGATTEDSAGAVPAGHSLREAAEVFVKGSDASNTAALGVLGGIALFLGLLVVLAFFVHVQVQPTEMLLGGIFVGAVAVSLFMLNTSLSSEPKATQSASVYESAAIERGVIVGEDAFSIEAGG